MNQLKITVNPIALYLSFDGNSNPSSLTTITMAMATPTNQCAFTIVQRLLKFVVPSCFWFIFYLYFSPFSFSSSMMCAAIHILSIICSSGDIVCYKDGMKFVVLLMECYSNWFSDRLNKHLNLKWFSMTMRHTQWKT